MRLNIQIENDNQIGQFFLPIGLLLEAQFDKIAQRYGDILGYFLLGQIF
jgi:hypothetical protein